ncbi:helix-turn-helix domain-containing protein [Rossellomorea sp. H39__3]
MDETLTSQENNIIGDRLTALRNKKNKRVVDVSNELKINRYTYTDWETGRRKPRGSKLVMLAKYYDTTVDYITGNIDDDTPNDVVELRKLLDGAQIVMDGKPISKEKARILEQLLKDLNKDS